MDNLEFYNKFKVVPEEAQKEIKGGRLKGFTDINPMWRLKVLTEVFGPVGIGWYYDINRSWTEPGAKGETAVFVEVHLYYKYENEWSKPITGVGGNTLIASENSGLRTNDECYKMALTDALSVACKALGIGADIYYAKDRSKYDDNPNTSDGNAAPPNDSPGAEGNKQQESGKEKALTEAQCKRYYAIAKKAGFDKNDADGLVLKMFHKENVYKITRLEYDRVCTGLEKKPEETMEWYKKKAS